MPLAIRPLAVSLSLGHNSSRQREAGGRRMKRITTPVAAPLGSRVVRNILEPNLERGDGSVQ